MSAGYLVLTFLGGSAVGAIGAAGVTAWHNSTERLRERMVAAAETFLVAVEEARTALWAVQVSGHELLEAKNDAVAYAATALEKTEAFNAAVTGQTGLGDVPAAYQQALGTIQRFMEATSGQDNPLDIARRGEAVLMLEAAQETLRALHEEVEPPLNELAPVIRETIRKQSRFLTAMQGRGDAAPALYAALHAVHGAVARVVLSFPASGAGLSDVAERAEALKKLLLDAQAAYNQAMIAESDPLHDAETVDLVQASNTAQEAFALSANLEIGKRRSAWKKYGD